MHPHFDPDEPDFLDDAPRYDDDNRDAAPIIGDDYDLDDPRSRYADLFAPPEPPPAEPVADDGSWYLTEPLEWFAAAGATFVPLNKNSKRPRYAEWHLAPYLLREILPYVEDGFNVGMLCGAPSDNLCVLDLDSDLRGFLYKFPQFMETPRISRYDNDTRAKILIRIEGDAPPPKKWKPNLHLPPRAEWLSTGNQAVIPPSIHPSGAHFNLEYGDQPIPTLSAAQMSDLWRALTGEPLLKRAPSLRDEFATPPTFAPLESVIPNVPSSAREQVTPDKLKEIICSRLDMVAYACYMTGSEAKQEGSEWRIVGQGGLLIDPANGRWNTFSEDGMGHTGGDCFDLIAYLNWRVVRPKGQQWREVLRLGAAYLGIEVVEHAPKSSGSNSAYSPAHTGGSMHLPNVWDVMGELEVLWDGWLVGSFVTLIGGVPGAGKSSFVLKLIHDYLHNHLPDGSPVPEEFAGRNVLYYFAEGFTEQSQALRSWGLEQEQLNRIQVPYLLGPEEGAIPNFSFPLDEAGKDALTRACNQSDPGIIIIDGMRAAMVGEEGSSKEAEEFFYFIQALASRHKASVILTHHLTKEAMRAVKEGKAPSIEMIRGSSVIVARCRAVALIDIPDPADPATRRVTLARSSSGTQQQQIAFHMQDPRDGVTFVDYVPQNPPASKKEEAERFILEALRLDGPLRYEKLIALAADEGFSEGTLRLARSNLVKGGKIEQTGEGKTYLWQLVNQEDTLPRF